MLKDLRNFLQFVGNFSILEDLKLFRPICDIVTDENDYDYKNKRLYTNKNRRNIIKQWWQYALWANRIKREKERHPNFDLFDLENMTRREYYSNTINHKKVSIKLDPQPLLHERSMFKENMSVAQSVVNELRDSRKKHNFNIFMKYYNDFLQRIYINFRFQEITFAIYREEGLPGSYNGGRGAIVSGREKPCLEFILGRTRFAFKIHQSVLSGELLVEEIKACDLIIRREEDVNQKDYSYLMERDSISPSRITDRQTELFAKYYDNDDPIFVSNFGGSERSRITYKSPLRGARRSRSPGLEGMHSIMDQNEEIVNSSNEFEINNRGNRSLSQGRSFSQSRYSEFPVSKIKNLSRTDESQRSLSRFTDFHHGNNRYSNQPSQKDPHRAHLPGALRSEVMRSMDYSNTKIETKKKSLAEIVDDAIQEKDSIYFNPDYSHMDANEHNFEGDTPIFHSRATFDPYSIQPAIGFWGLKKY